MSDEVASNWDDLIALQRRFEPGLWIYRGHRVASWPLESTLERAARRFGTKPTLTIEGGLLRQFARRAHHHLDDVPQRDQWVEWLALMQHHGAPTRLLDFSYSFFVGLYFALEEYTADEECALWAVDMNWVNARLRRIVGEVLFDTYEGKDRNIERARTFRRYFGSGTKMVFGVNPYRLNQRLSIQQGIFLCPGDVSESFVDNLAALGYAGKHILRVKIRLKLTEYRKCVERLSRMNMTRTSLFPGLDGFASSQKWMVAMACQIRESRARSADQSSGAG